LLRNVIYINILSISVFIIAD